MTFPGYSRVKKVYPAWLLISIAILSPMLLFQLRYPGIVLLAILLFLGKDILIYYKIITSILVCIGRNMLRSHCS